MARTNNTPKDWPGTGEPPTMTGYKAPYTLSIAEWFFSAREYLETMVDARRRRTASKVLAYMVAHVAARDSLADGSPVITASVAQLSEETGLRRETVGDAIQMLCADGGPLVCVWKPKRGQKWASCYTMRTPSGVAPRPKKRARGQEEGEDAQEGRNGYMTDNPEDIGHDVMTANSGDSGHESCTESLGDSGHDVMTDNSPVMTDNSAVMTDNSCDSGHFALTPKPWGVRGASPDADAHAHTPRTCEGDLVGDSTDTAADRGGAACAVEGTPHHPTAGESGVEGMDATPTQTWNRWEPWADKLTDESRRKLEADAILADLFVAEMTEHPHMFVGLAYSESYSKAQWLRRQREKAATGRAPSGGPYDQTVAAEAFALEDAESWSP